MSERLRISERESYPSYEDVASIDPLKTDQIMEYLPELNRQGDVDAIREATAYALAGTEALAVPTRAEALAAINELYGCPIAPLDLVRYCALSGMDGRSI
jgi:acyl-CoA reductase-like NAD-dependent aldehyde dehydrogenase